MLLSSIKSKARNASRITPVLRVFLFSLPRMKSRGKINNMETPGDHTVQAKSRGTRRWLLPAIIFAAFAIRMVVVCFTYGNLPLVEEYLSHPQFGWEMGWIARALASGHGLSSPYYP